MPPAEQPQRSGLAIPAGRSLGAPIWGSGLLFPRRFNQAVASALSDPGAAFLQPSHAFWYFGAGLTLQIDPQRLVWRLSDYVRDHRGARYIGASFLDAADWSGALQRLKNSPIHREMLQVIAADLQFRKTPAYENLQRRAAKGQPETRSGIVLQSTEQVDAYFSYCRDLIISVREHGVQPRRSFRAKRRPFAAPHRGRSVFWESSERDIGVAIGHNGLLIRHLGGKHRTAIAQALGIATIPVEVRLVHVAWLARQMQRLDLPAHLALPAALEEMNRFPQEPRTLTAARRLRKRRRKRRLSPPTVKSGS